MCGIVGVAGYVGVKEEKAFKNLLVFDSVRGEHSTGVAAVHYDEEVSVAKSVGDPFILMDTKGFDSIMKKANRVLIGHNRFATTGKITRKNAHPFEFESLVGVHNGTLTNKFDIEGSGAFDVDSEALYNLMDKKGVEATIPVLRGAWALVWYDKYQKTINLIRNKERTLYYSTSKDGKTLFWASEAWMLNVALSRNEIQFEAPKLLDTDSLHSWEIDFKGLSIQNFTTKPLKGKEEVAVVAGKKTYGTTIGGFTKTTGIDNNYFGSTQTFEVISKGRDNEGGTFYILEDALNVTKDVRLYYTANKYSGKEGWKFKGKVSGVKKGVSGNYYYKVEFIGPFFFEKKEHKTVTEKEHNAKFSSCAWCDEGLEYGSPNVVYGRQQAFCSKCAATDEIKQLGVL